VVWVNGQKILKENGGKAEAEQGRKHTTRPSALKM
jgi:hypothetical protein